MSSSRPGGLSLIGILTAAAAVLAGGGVVALGGQPGGAPAPAGGGGTEILGAGTYWRWHVTHRKPAVDPEADGKKGAAPEPLPMLGDNANHRGCDRNESAPPPKDWAGPEFDDSSWPRTSIRWMYNAQGAKLSQAALSIRGKFAVADPAVALTLTGKYPRWRTGELLGLSLAAAWPRVTPNVGRPAGAQVWVQDRNDRVYGPDYGDPGEPLEKYPLRIVGAPAGDYRGEVAVTTLRFEADCEGLAAAEAPIVVSEALFARRDALGPELAAECEKALAERLAWLWRSVEGTGGHFHTYHYGWQDLNRRLFDCAAAAAKKAK